MNTAIQVGLVLLGLVAIPTLLFGWLSIAWDFCDRHSEMPFIGYVGVYFSPLIAAGLICLCYGLVVQPKTTEPKEEAVTKEELQTTLDKHLHDLVQHYANVDHKQVHHPDNGQPGVYITHLEFVDLNGIVTTLRLLEEE